MMKNVSRIIVLTALLVLTASAAFAASVEGKVSACDGARITINVADGASWLKKGAMVKVLGVAGTVTEVAGTTVTVKTGKTADCKPGDDVSLVKSYKETSGC